MGRTSTYTQEIADAICHRLSEGETLASICRGEGMPATRTVSDWAAAHKDFAACFARARDLGFDAIADDTIAIADEAPGTTTFGGTDSGAVAHQKLRVETRLKLLAKWSPKRYGDRLEIDGKLEVDVASRIVAARKRAGTGE